MYLRRGFSWDDHGPILVVVLILVVIVGATLVECKQRQECREKGGAVVEYNCRMITTCTTHRSGNTSYTTCHPQQVCDWRCEMPPKPPAEAPP